jgi:hypothetical protein
MSESEDVEDLNRLGPRWAIYEKSVFWPNKEKSPPVGDISESGFKKRVS